MMRIVVEPGQNFSAFLAARMVFGTVLLAVAAVLRPAEVEPTPYIVLFAANTALSLGGWEWYRSQRSIRALKWLTLTAAVILDTLVLYYTEPGGSLFVFLYFFSVGAAGLLTGVAGSTWTALLSVLGLAWLSWQRTGGLNADETSRVLMYALNFGLLAALSSYFHAWFRRRERAHRETLGELRQARLDTQAILDSLNTGVVVVDAERHVLYSNPAGRVFLSSRANAGAAELEFGLRPETGIGRLLAAAGHETCDEWTHEVPWDVKGYRRTIGCNVSALLNVQGTLRGHLLLLTDLTPMKAAERAERERERLAAIGMLSRDLAHEIRNPLATVRGCVEVIRDMKDRTDQRRFLDLALKESDRLNDILRDFLTFAQIENPRKRPADLAEFVRGRVPREPIGIAFIVRLPDRLEVTADPDQLALVIDALILSLAVWAEGRGEIRIEAVGADEHGVRFMLPGKTVPSEYRTAVFQPFSNVNRAGHGLALPTALRAVHAHGGELKLETEPGTGTWFDLKL